MEGGGGEAQAEVNAGKQMRGKTPWEPEEEGDNNDGESAVHRSQPLNRVYNVHLSNAEGGGRRGTGPPATTQKGSQKD